MKKYNKYRIKMKKDLFGFDTQGKKYDLYRPRYPKKLLSTLIERVKHRNRYLDVATGTGQILF
jgi:ubiquinone/menaquinone biosynthesis C-methylase UbiE